MRITLIANPDNIHVRRWIEFLAGRGHALTLVTDPFTKARPGQCNAILVPRWGLASNILAFRLTPKPFGNDLWKFMHYRPLVAASRPDVVHGFEAFNNGLATAWAGPYPKVLTPWGNDVYHDAFASRLGRFMVTRAVRGVDMISTNDETIGEHLAARLGVDRERVRAFTWGVDLDLFHPRPAGETEALRRSLEIPEGAPVVLSSRNFRPYWGIDLLLEAAPAVLRGRPGTVFVFLRGGGGDPEYLAAARRRAESEGWAGAARFVDRVLEADELAGLLTMAEAFVSIPRTDLLAQTVLEGMACGALPVLADHAGYRKHARDGENAVVLSEYTAAGVERALREALENGALRAAARWENPRLIAEQENWKINALKMEEVYAAAIAHYQKKA